jgi:hypothetical protein
LFIKDSLKMWKIKCSLKIDSAAPSLLEREKVGEAGSGIVIHAAPAAIPK